MHVKDFKQEKKLNKKTQLKHKNDHKIAFISLMFTPDAIPV